MLNGENLSPIKRLTSMTFRYDRPYIYVHVDTGNTSNIIFFIVIPENSNTFVSLDDSQIGSGTLSIYMSSTAPVPAPTYVTKQTASFTYTSTQVITVNTYLDGGSTPISTIAVHTNSVEQR